MATEYDIALNKFRRASSTFREARVAYRARTIGDSEFLAARAAYDLANNECDAALKVTKIRSSISQMYRHQNGLDD